MGINVGSTDRLIRIIAGIVLLALPFVVNMQSTAATVVSVVVGLVLLLTAARKSCPLYSILGIRTNSRS